MTRRKAPVPVGDVDPVAGLGSEDEGVAGAARALLRERVNAKMQSDEVDALIDSVMSMTSLADAFCPDCRRKVRVEIPDPDKRIRALKGLLEEAEGKPGNDQGGVSIVIERPPLTFEEAVPA